MSVFTPLDQDTLLELCSEFGVQANRTRQKALKTPIGM